MINNAVYLCDNGVKVADWNYLEPMVLECGTPCAGKGYGGSLCDKSTYWAVCVRDDEGTSICRYLNKKDDCSCISAFAIPPSSVAVYYI